MVFMFKLQGVVPPMITPFDREGELDIPNLERLVDYLKERVNGLYICGSYGSGPMMNLEERKKVADVCVKIANGKIPIISHTGTTNTRDTVELTRHAEKIGCDGAAAVGPYYFHHSKDGVLAFYESMLDSVSPGYPIYLYHNPKFSGYEISLDTIKSLKEHGLHGIKDATFDIMKLATYMRELGKEEFDVVLGTESMWLSARALGAEAYIPGLGNAFPEICTKMWQEGMNNDFEACRQTQFKVNRLRDVMYLARSTQLAVYAMLEIRGIIQAYPRSPFVPATDKEKDNIRKALNMLGVLIS
jgi:dihydrodipicolinate synthase/N-acetylneuraminate lyase